MINTDYNRLTDIKSSSTFIQAIWFACLLDVQMTSFVTNCHKHKETRTFYILGHLDDTFVQSDLQ